MLGDRAASSGGEGKSDSPEGEADLLDIEEESEEKASIIVKEEEESSEYEEYSDSEDEDQD